jgi:hypothetical protein
MFRCTRCNKEINSLSAPDRCPHCGVYFSGVRCDGCGYTGSKFEFIGSRCPKCKNHVEIPFLFQSSNFKPTEPLSFEDWIGFIIIIFGLIFFIISLFD